MLRGGKRSWEITLHRMQQARGGHGSVEVAAPDAAHVWKAGQTTCSRAEAMQAFGEGVQVG
jgi:hypothetical protein